MTFFKGKLKKPGFASPTLLFNDLVAKRTKTGVGTYAGELARLLPSALLRLQSPIEFHVLSKTPWGSCVSRLEQTVSQRSKKPKRAPSKKDSSKSRGWGMAAFDKRKLMAWGAQIFAPKNFSLFHEPDAVSLMTRRPFAITVHDLSVWLMPEFHPPYRLHRYHKHFEKQLKTASLIFSVSHFTRDALSLYFGVPKDKVHVTLAAPRSFFKKCDRTEISRIQKTYRLPESYLLYVGNIEPRKNLLALLNAYDSLSPTLKSRFPLVFAGPWGWQYDGVAKKMATLRSHLYHLGYVRDADLPAIYGGATAFLYPSLYEGFGFPPLEAMACGTPVISSHAGSLEEVVGDAVRVIDPNSVEDIADALCEVIESPELRRDLVHRGESRVKRYAWDDIAFRVAGIYCDYFQ